MQERFTLWSAILLSALLFNLAFFFSSQFCFLIIFFPVSIWFFQQKIVLLPMTGKQKIAGSFAWGAAWGLLVFGFHFNWLLSVLVNHSEASLWLCLLLYGVVVVYFSITSGVWFGITTAVFHGLTFLTKRGLLFFQLILFALVSVIYWLFIDLFGGYPLGLNVGYPFINPFIPLAQSRFFLTLISSGMLFFGSGGVNTKIPFSVCYLNPVVNRVENVNVSWRGSPTIVGRKIYKKLTKQTKTERHAVIWVAPESMFLFPLNEHEEIIHLWRSALGEKDHFLLGSIYEKAQEKGVAEFKQVVYWLQKSLIINFYVKQTLVPFVEQLPPLWAKIKPLKELFIKDGGFFSAKEEQKALKVFDITPTFRVIPQVCSEFFFANSLYDFELYKDKEKETAIFFFANDSWFNSFFRAILCNLASLKSKLIGMRVLHIGHFGCCGS